MPKGGPGQKKSEEHRKNISCALKGKKKSDTHRKNLSKPKTLEHRQNISLAVRRPERSEKFKKTCLERFGYDHPSRDPARNNLNTRYWVERGFTEEHSREIIFEHQRMASKMVQNRKSHWVIDFWLEKGLTLVESKQKVSELQINNASKSKVTKSKESDLFLNRLEQLCGLKIEREVVLLNRFKVDGYIAEKKVVIEYFGSFWHMHPTLFEDNDIHRVTGWLAKSKWAEDNGRIKLLKKNGYKVIVIWDLDANKIINSVAKMIIGGK